MVAEGGFPEPGGHGMQRRVAAAPVRPEAVAPAVASRGWAAALRLLLTALTLGWIVLLPRPGLASFDPLQVSVPVADQRTPARRGAERAGLETVLVRLAGTESVLEAEAVRAALRTPQNYYSTSSYARRPPAERRAGDTYAADDGEAPWLLRLEFDRASLFALLAQAQVPVWTGRRPEVLVWIAREDEDGRIELIGAEHPAGRALLEVGQRRGVPVVLPLLDLEDLSNLSPRDVWARFDEPIERASRRYAHDARVVLRLYPDPVGRWIADWQGTVAGEAVDGSVEIDDGRRAGAALVDEIADRLVARYAVRSGMAESLWLQVDGIDAIQPYAEMMRYLGAVHGVEAVQLAQVQGSSMLLRVDASDAAERLLDLLRLEARMVPRDRPEMAGGVPVWRARWQR